jgi:hypothetical protein
LQQNTALSSSNWSDVLSAPDKLEGHTEMSVSSSTGDCFFRLRKD